MKLGLRIFIGYFLAIGLFAWLSLYWINSELKPLVRQASEEALVETAYALAATLQPSLINTGAIDPVIASSLMQHSKTPLDANIWGIAKRNLRMLIYVTDAQGIVIFDSSNKNVGSNFSKWNDVYLTLDGRYGVRSTRLNPDDEASTIMYVAAPIKLNDKIVGSLTAAFPNENIQAHLTAAQNRLYLYGAVILIASLLIGLLFTGWLILSLRVIGRFAEHAAERNSVIPAFAKGTELEKLTLSISRMRDELEGQHLLENYVNHFTHELKSPLSAIRASNELLTDSAMSEQQRIAFSEIIDQQCRKLQILTDRLLQLIRLEKKRQLDTKESVHASMIIQEEMESLQYLATKRDIQLCYTCSDNEVINGDRLLVAQAVHNLLENALQFANTNTAIEIQCFRKSDSLMIAICNIGPAIPAYALPRLGERFYSLPHPDGSKGTGLGLAFVNEIAALHNGDFQIRNTETGVCCEIGLSLK